MYDLFQEMVLTEAVPRKAAELKINPDPPPDITKPPGDQIPQQDDNQQQQNQQASDTIPQEAMPQGANQQAQDQQQMIQQGGQQVDPNIEQGPQEGEEEVPPEEEEQYQEEDPNQPMGPEGMEPAQGPEDDLQAAEQDVFRDFTPEQLKLRDRELKKRFQELNSIIIETIEKINKVTKTTYDANMLDFIIRKLIDLKEISRDSLVDGFKTRTYTQNRMELEKIATEFNLITNMVEEIYNSRLKRTAKYNKGALIRPSDIPFDQELTQDFSI